MRDRHYYALSDSFTGAYPKEPTWGFANTTTAIAFRSKAERDEYLSTTKLCKARAITRAEACKLTRTVQGLKLVDIIGAEPGDYCYVTL